MIRRPAPAPCGVGPGLLSASTNQEDVIAENSILDTAYDDDLDDEALDRISGGKVCSVCAGGSGSVPSAKSAG